MDFIDAESRGQACQSADGAEILAPESEIENSHDEHEGEERQREFAAVTGEKRDKRFDVGCRCIAEDEAECRDHKKQDIFDETRFLVHVRLNMFFEWMLMGCQLMENFLDRGERTQTPAVNSSDDKSADEGAQKEHPSERILYEGRHVAQPGLYDRDDREHGVHHDAEINEPACERGPAQRIIAPDEGDDGNEEETHGYDDRDFW